MISSLPTPRVAVDANGGDHGPAVVVAGAVAAQRELGDGVAITLVGDEQQVRAQLSAQGADEAPFDVVHAPGNIGMDESPATAIRRKKDSSIVVGSELLRAGEVDAHVSAGSTGAMTAASLLIVGRLPGVSRPAIATPLPTAKGMALLLDAGANVDCKPRHLLQFAAMGRIYAEHVLRNERPGVGLLNIGEEPGKGDELSQAAHQLLRDHEPNFIGNVEGREMFDGRAGVIVADGFVGNVVLKVMEGFGQFLLGGLRDEIQGANPLAKLGALALRPTMKQFRARFDYAEYGGAPLLGCDGVIIIGHGGSPPLAIQNAIKLAARGVRDRVPARIAEEIEREAAELAAEAAEGPADGGNEA